MTTQTLNVGGPRYRQALTQTQRTNGARRPSRQSVGVSILRIVSAYTACLSDLQTRLLFHRLCRPARTVWLSHKYAHPT